jgi:hypothetical protein
MIRFQSKRSLGISSFIKDDIICFKAPNAAGDPAGRMFELIQVLDENQANSARVE